MATPLPITITGSPLPGSFSGTPQEIMDAIIARLSIETDQAFVLVGTGPVLPVSDQGPFLLDGNKLYVWDAGSGSYVPVTIEFLSQLNTKPFRANASADQAIVMIGPSTVSMDLAYDQEYDPDGVYDANTFTAPDAGFYNVKAKIGITSGAADLTATTNIIILFYLKKNGFQMPREQVFSEVGNTATGRTYFIDTNVQLAAGDTITTTVQVFIDGPSSVTWTITQNETWFAGSKIRNLTYAP